MFRSSIDRGEYSLTTWFLWLLISTTAGTAKPQPQDQHQGYVDVQIFPQFETKSTLAIYRHCAPAQ